LPRGRQKGQENKEKRRKKGKNRRKKIKKEKNNKEKTIFMPSLHQKVM
jgi:hypothetical protein